MRIINLQNVFVKREQNTLLKNFTWEVLEGERWVVIGPNGAGKTTLMQILAAQMHPTLGTVKLLGSQLGQVDVFELRTRIGMASADLAERIPRTELVKDVIISAAHAVMGRWKESYEPQDEVRAHYLMQQMNVDSLAARTFGTLSEGERKRVQIARALMTDPELLILDEPGAGLDLAGREHLVSTLTQLAADTEAPTQILVTHHVEEIPDGYTHAMLLQQGQIVAAGPLSQVITGKNLSSTFGLPLRLYKSGGRYTARQKTTANAPIQET